MPKANRRPRPVSLKTCERHRSVSSAAFAYILLQRDECGRKPSEACRGGSGGHPHDTAEMATKDTVWCGRSGGFLAGDLGAFPPGLRQADGNCLLAAFNALAALTAFQRALFPFVHCSLHGFLGSFAVACHTHTSLPHRILSVDAPNAGDIAGVWPVLSGVSLRA